MCSLQKKIHSKNIGLKSAVLSLSLFMVMAGSAIAPALGAISLHFHDVHPLLIKMILTVPSFCIIVVSFLFHKIPRNISTKTIAIIGLSLYVIGGVGGGFCNTITVLLLLRAVLGIGVGLLMPLSTGLISYYFEPEEQRTLLGYSSAMVSMGAVFSSTLAGYLVHISWRYSFYVYISILISFVLVIIFLPNEQIKQAEQNDITPPTLKNGFYYCAMFFTMLIFYVFISHFALISTKERLFPLQHIGLIMSVQNVASLLCGLYFGKITSYLKEKTAYIAAVFFVIGYALLAVGSSVTVITISLFFLGSGLGCLIPYLNTVALAHNQKSYATRVMAYMGASMHLGQFTSPFVLRFFMKIIHAETMRMPYVFAIAASLCLVIFLYLNKKKLS